MTLKPMILLVDDHEVFRSHLSELLRQDGYQVMERANGKEAIAAVVDETPNLIVIDMNMPVLDGLNATTQIRRLGKRFQKLPILLISANSAELREAAISAGCTGYCSKHEVNQLLMAIARLLEYPSSSATADQ